jgi:signal peptidase I
MAKTKTRARRTGTVRPGTAPKPSKPPKRSGGHETLKTLIYALLIALVIRTFIVQAFRIPSGSMEDTLLIGDFLLVDKITYGARVPGTRWRLPGFREPRRGDIIVFKDPLTSRDYIKRCIAVGGETIELKSNDVYINGRPIQEPYKALKFVRGGNPRDDYGPLKISPKALFMMGDNRNNSQDSRYSNELDPIRVVGRAFVLYWSTDPQRSPLWVQNMSEGWIKGFLQLFLGRPRIRRIGTWLAKDYRGLYAETLQGEPALPSSPGPGAAAAAPLTEAKEASADAP